MKGTPEAAGAAGHRQPKRIIAGLLVIALLAFAQGPIFIPAHHGGVGSGGGGPVTYSAISVVLSGGTTPIYVPLGGGGLGSTTETDVQMRVHAVTTYSNVCTRLSVAPGGGNSIVVQMRDNAANTGITMTISGAAVSACDTTHTFTNAADDLMDFSIVPSGVIALFTPDVNIYGQAGSISAGAVNAGTINQTAYYAANGSTLSGGGPGTAGQVWTSNGAGTPATFQAAGGGATFAQPYAFDGANYFGPIFQVVKPTDTTWINQNGASETLVNGAAVITRPNIATSTDNVSCRVITNAASTYTLTIGMIGNFITSANGSNIFAMVGDSGGGRAVFNGQVVFSINTPTLASAVVHSTTYTSNWSAIQQVITPLAYGPVWYRIQDDGANMNFFVSRDGIGFIQIFTEPNTTWLPSSPANQLGFCAEQIGQALGIGMTMTVFHMGITSP